MRTCTGQTLRLKKTSIPTLHFNQNRVLRTDGRLEDEGDFGDFYIQPTDDMDLHEQKELQELQDEELARLLQDQEKKVRVHYQSFAWLLGTTHL